MYERDDGEDGRYVRRMHDVMKVSLYIEKKDFDGFFVWMNRLKSGVLIPPPVFYIHTRNSLRDPLHVSLTPDEYNLIQDAEKNLEDIQEIWGNLDIQYDPRALNDDKIMMADILRNAQRYDMGVDVVNTAIELAMQIPGITPLEAMIISEKEWLNVGKTYHE